MVYELLNQIYKHYLLFLSTHSSFLLQINFQTCYGLSFHMLKYKQLFFMSSFHCEIHFLFALSLSFFLFFLYSGKIHTQNLP